MWPAMQKAIDLTDDPERLADLCAELAFESTLRGGMWKRPIEHSLVQSWLDRALELAAPDSPAQGRALVTKAMWEDDAEIADQAVDLAERLEDPFFSRTRASLARVPPSSRATTRPRTTGNTALCAARPAHRPRQDRPYPLLRRHRRTGCWPARRGRGTRSRARCGSHLGSALTTRCTHSACCSSSKRRSRTGTSSAEPLQPRVERAVAENTGTPCVLNPRTLLSCAVASAELGLDEEARRLENGRSCPRLSRVWVLAPSAGRPPRAPSRRPRARGGVAGRVRVDVAHEHGREPVRHRNAPRSAPRPRQDRRGRGRGERSHRAGHLRRALRAAHARAARGEPALVAQAVDRFEAIGLDRHARRTREQVGV